MVLFILPGLLVAGLGYYINAKRKPDPSSLKKCPVCAESIKKEARVCRFCGLEFASPPAPDSRT